MNNWMNVLLSQKTNSFESYITKKEEEKKMDEKCTVCGAESKEDCKCPDDCPSCGT